MVRPESISRYASATLPAPVRCELSDRLAVAPRSGSRVFDVTHQSDPLPAYTFPSFDSVVAPNSRRTSLDRIRFHVPPFESESVPSSLGYPLSPKSPRQSRPPVRAPPPLVDSAPPVLSRLPRNSTVLSYRLGHNLQVLNCAEDNTAETLGVGFN